ncbi:hypothetical protein [Flavobacterium sp.]|uniref:hypothetical protein n=1 Tax=Flavobacterium sp. TaxID=239 RepID=UPI0037510BC9
MAVKKPLPYSVTKEELVTMYLDQKPQLRIITQINEILKEKNISIHIKKIEHPEFMEYVETYGTPKGYYIEDND